VLVPLNDVTDELTSGFMGVLLSLAGSKEERSVNWRVGSTCEKFLRCRCLRVFTRARDALGGLPVNFSFLVSSVVYLCVWFFSFYHLSLPG
jgi:hypothetical protein